MSKQNNRQGQTKPKEQAVKVENPSISRLNDKYASKISAGEIEVTASRAKSRLSPNEAYDHRVKQKKLAQAQKEKEELEKKLAYLDHSIKSIQQYDYSSAKVSPESSPSPKNSATDVKQILKKNQQFHKRIREERQKLNEKKEIERRKQQQKIKIQQQKMAQQIEEQKNKRKQQIYQNMQKIKTRMENRQSQIRKQEEEYHKVIGGTTLFKKLEKEYAQHQQTILQERKKKLANIRNLHKPINISQIEEHQKKFFEALQEKKSLRDRQRRLSNAVEQYSVSYKSAHHKQYSQGHSRLDQDNQSRVKAEKIKQFSEHVREHFAPQIDERKREDREKILQSQLQKKRRQEMKQDQDKQRVEQIRNKGLRYLQEIRDLPKKRQESSKTGPVTERPRYTNYLSHSQHNGKVKWGTILESKVSKKDKAIRLQFEAEKMETSLKLKEQKARVLKKDPDEVDQEYYEMIKAKLELLQI